MKAARNFAVYGCFGVALALGRPAVAMTFSRQGGSAGAPAVPSLCEARSPARPLADATRGGSLLPPHGMGAQRGGASARIGTRRAATGKGRDALTVRSRSHRSRTLARRTRRVRSRPRGRSRGSRKALARAPGARRGVRRGVGRPRARGVTRRHPADPSWRGHFRARFRRRPSGVALRRRGGASVHGRSRPPDGALARQGRRLPHRRTRRRSTAIRRRRAGGRRARRGRRPRRIRAEPSGHPGDRSPAEARHCASRDCSRTPSHRLPPAAGWHAASHAQVRPRRASRVRVPGSDLDPPEAAGASPVAPASTPHP